MIFYTTLRAKENLHRFLCKFHTFECVKFTHASGKVSGKVSGKADHRGHGAFSLHSLRFIHDDDGHERTGGGDGRGRGYVGGGNEINNDSVEQSLCTDSTSSLISFSVKFNTCNASSLLIRALPKKDAPLLAASVAPSATPDFFAFCNAAAYAAGSVLAIMAIAGTMS